MSATRGTGYVECDGCDAKFNIGKQWPVEMLASSAPDGGWDTTIGDNGVRTDLCPECKHKPR